MNQSVSVLVALAVAVTSAQARAEILVPKGTRAILDVEYQYVSEGKYESPSKDNRGDWRTRRVVNLTATLVADGPSPFGALHGAATGQPVMPKNLQPMMSEMQKIGEKCGNDENCMTQAMMAYAASMKSSGKLDAATKPGEPRFQVWNLTTQAGTSEVDELTHKQIFEMTCTVAKPCTRVVNRKGPGKLAAASVGYPAIEVDGVGKDMILILPAPHAPVTVEQRVATNIPGEKDNGTITPVIVSLHVPDPKPLTVAIPADLRTVSGSKTIQVPGNQVEGGTLTVKWQFTRQ